MKFSWINLLSVEFTWLPFQIANNSGYIQVDWKRVEKDVNKAKKQLKKGTDQAGPELNTFMEKVRVSPDCFSKSCCFFWLTFVYTVLWI